MTTSQKCRQQILLRTAGRNAKPTVASSRPIGFKSGKYDLAIMPSPGKTGIGMVTVGYSPA